jgi:hypothetical protein
MERWNAHGPSFPILAEQTQSAKMQHERMLGAANVAQMSMRASNLVERLSAGCRPFLAP